MRRIVSLCVLLVACQEPLGPASVVPPPCLAPAPLGGTYTPAAPGYLVLFKRGVDAATEVDRLEARYRFTADDVWDAVGGFFVEDITPPIVARLRCEPSVSAVDHDGIASVGTE